MKRRELAEWGEKTAADYLAARNINIVEKNFRTRTGEIDLIGYDNKDLVFFEIKTRSSKKFGYPEEAIDKKKLEKIEAVAGEYIDLRNIDNINWRIDAVAIIRNPLYERHQIKWFKDVR